MKLLFIIDAQPGAKAARFWKGRGKRALERFPLAEELHLDPNRTDLFTPGREFEVIVLVGSDAFFSRMINQSFELLQEHCPQTPLCFWPIGRSAMAESLDMPKSADLILELIQKKASLPLDLVRCHCIDHHGHPASRLILNDAAVRLAPSPLPLPLRTAMVKNAAGGPNNLTLMEGDKELYKGGFQFAMLLLGKGLTGGPRIRSHNRFGHGKFGYLQINRPGLYSAKALGALFGSGIGEECVSGQFEELELKAIGEQNLIWADGLQIGRLPASFTLLPKALRVISPLMLHPITNPWKKPASAPARAATDRLPRSNRSLNWDDNRNVKGDAKGEPERP